MIARGKTEGSETLRRVKEAAVLCHTRGQEASAAVAATTTAAVVAAALDGRRDHHRRATGTGKNRRTS